MSLSIPMTEARAREVLRDLLNRDDSLNGGDSGIHGPLGDADEPYILVYGKHQMDADLLEALAWWIRNKS